jgi:hypothetical protein
MSYQTYLSKLPPVEHNISLNNINNINNITDIKDFTFENFKQNPQILIVGAQEYNTTEILKLIIKKLKTMVSTSNTTVYTQQHKTVKYQLPSTITCYSHFNSSTIEDILASQMDTPDELYSNKWQNFDTCINIFDRCFSESEFEILYKAQFNKLYKYSSNYKIINIIITNYMYESQTNNNFDYIFCTSDTYTLNVDRIAKSLFYLQNVNFYWIFDKCATKESALVIQKDGQLCVFSKLKYCFLIKEIEPETEQILENNKKFRLVCQNDSFLSSEKLESIEI